MIGLVIFKFWRERNNQLGKIPRAGREGKGK